MKLKMMQLNSNWSQSKNQIELHLFWIEVFLKKWNWKWCILIQTGFSLKSQIELHLFWVEVFLKKWNSKWCNLIQSGLSLLKPNWVAPFLGWSFLKEMSLKMMQLNSKWSLYKKSQIELHLFWVEVFLKKWNSKWCNLIQTGLCIKIAKLSCTFFRLHVSKRNEIENDATQFKVVSV